MLLVMGCLLCIVGVADVYACLLCFARVRVFVVSLLMCCVVHDVLCSGSGCIRGTPQL